MSTMNNSLSVRPLFARFNETELEVLEQKLGELPHAEDGDVELFFEDVNEAVLDEFVDRLGSAAADVYLPVRFKKPFGFEGITCGSAHALLEALDAMRGELGLDDEKDERDPRFAKQRNLWKRFRAGAKAAIRERLVLDLVRM
ncbi:MAG: hypothetical protein ACO1OB_16410 [Archangium sp.]